MEQNLRILLSTRADLHVDYGVGFNRLSRLFNHSFADNSKGREGRILCLVASISKFFLNQTQSCLNDLERMNPRILNQYFFRQPVFGFDGLPLRYWETAEDGDKQVWVKQKYDRLGHE